MKYGMNQKNNTFKLMKILSDRNGINTNCKNKFQ